MKRFREIVLNTTAPESPDVVWAKPEDGNTVLYVCEGGEWKKITNASESGDDSGDVTPIDTNAVEYTPQILTEAQQMQARQNQGLYYSKEFSSATVNWDGDTTNKEHVTVTNNEISHTYYKISDVAPRNPESIEYKWSGWEYSHAMSTGTYFETGTYIQDAKVVVAFNDNTYVNVKEEQNTSYGSGYFNKGVYVLVDETNYVQWFYYGAFTEVSKVPPLYIPLSTNVETDGNSDLMAATPKAVKTYVDNALSTPTIVDMTETHPWLEEFDSEQQNSAPTLKIRDLDGFIEELIPLVGAVPIKVAITMVRGAQSVEGVSVFAPAGSTTQNLETVSTWLLSVGNDTSYLTVDSYNGAGAVVLSNQVASIQVTATEWTDSEGE